jgi:hypothetical protein
MNIKNIPDTYRITQRDFKSFDSFLDKAFASTGTERLKRWASGREFFSMMVTAQNLKLKGQKIITLGHVRLEQKRQREEQQRKEKEHRAFLDSLGKSK